MGQGAGWGGVWGFPVHSLIFNPQAQRSRYFLFFFSKCCISLSVKSKSDKALGLHFVRIHPISWLHEGYSWRLFILPSVDPREANGRGREGNPGHVLPARPPWPPPGTHHFCCGVVPASLVQLLRASTSQQSCQGDWGLEEGWWGAIHPSTTQEPDPNPSGAQVPWTHLPLLPWDMPTGPWCPYFRNKETTAQGAGHRPRCSWTLKPNSQHSCMDCGGPGVGWARSQKLWGRAPNASLLPAVQHRHVGSYHHCWCPSA